MSGRVEICIVIAVLVLFMSSCTELPESAAPGEGDIATETLPQIGSIPAKWGNLAWYPTAHVPTLSSHPTSGCLAEGKEVRMMSQLTSIVCRILFGGAFVLAGVAVWEKLANLWGFTLAIVYNPWRFMEASAVALLFVIALQLREMKLNK
jgi:hypothetical protein